MLALFCLTATSSSVAGQWINGGVAVITQAALADAPVRYRSDVNQYLLQPLNSLIFPDNYKKYSHCIWVRVMASRGSHTFSFPGELRKGVALRS